MSTPSTATAAHPSHHQHYGYSHHQTAYQTNGSYPTSSAGLANSYAYAANAPTSSLPYPQPSKAPPSSSSTAMPAYQDTNGSVPSGQTGGRRKKPDWGEFYKNGLPKEVIVIDDTPPPEQGTTDSQTQPPSSTVTVTNDTTASQPAGKRRRTGMETAYDVGYYDRPSYSIIPQQYGEDSSSGSISTDRTTSLHTTAPTSLGSQGSAGTSNGTYYDDANVGQKRKRVTTRKSARDEQKRRELETAGDAFLSYIPPPKPPIKAKEVHVPVIRDVSDNHQARKCALFAVLMEYAEFGR